MTAADDWTKEFATDGYPDVQRVFALAGAPDHVLLRPFLQFGHNYNGVSRAVMYEWFNRHLRLGYNEVPREQPFVPLSVNEASVWDAGHPKPPAGEAHERALLTWLTRDAAAALASACTAGHRDERPVHRGGRRRLRGRARRRDVVA